MWERPFASMNILKCATFLASSPLPYPPFATWVSWSTLCARLSRTFIVAVEQRQAGSSFSNSSDLYPFVPTQSTELCLSLFPPPLGTPIIAAFSAHTRIGCCTHSRFASASSASSASASSASSCCCFICAHRRWLLSPVRVNTSNTCAGFQCICVNTLKLNYLFTNNVCASVCALVCDLCIVIHTDSRQIPR